MPKPVRISLDAMGGDHGPSVVIPGAGLALERHPDLRFMIFGNEAVIAPLLATNPRLRGAAEIHHTEIAIGMDEPSVAIRAGRGKSSMWRAVRRCRTRKPTPASRQGIPAPSWRWPRSVSRPWPISSAPRLRRCGRRCAASIVLDVGATIGADAGILSTWPSWAPPWRIVFDLDRPSVGLLNVGTEEIKGIEAVKEASRLLREANLPNLDYRGFVEATTSGRAPSTWS